MATFSALFVQLVTLVFQFMATALLQLWGFNSSSGISF